MTLTEHIDIEIILIEASAYNLREEVIMLASKLMTEDENLSKLDAYVVAYKQTITLNNI